MQRSILFALRLREGWKSSMLSLSLFLFYERSTLPLPTPPLSNTPSILMSFHILRDADEGN